jgi:hypothetical protein
MTQQLLDYPIPSDGYLPNYFLNSEKNCPRNLSKTRRRVNDPDRN